MRRTNGLLTHLTDERSLDHRFEYDSMGRLQRDANPSGGVKGLGVGQTAGNAITTTVTTAEGRTSTFLVEPYGTGQRRTATEPDGLVTTWDRLPGGTNTKTLSDQSTQTWTESLDPRFLMQAPLTSSFVDTVKVSTGPDVYLTYNKTQSASAHCYASDPCDTNTTTECTTANVTHLRNRTDTIDVNANETTVYYDSCSATTSLPYELTTSPQGRTRQVDLDALGRTKIITIPGVEPITLTWDTDGRVSEIDQGSRTLTRTFHTTSTSGEKGQLADTTIHLPTSVTTTYSSYDAVARPLSITLPGSGRTVDFTYDNAGNLASLDPPGTTAASHSFDYEGTNRLATYAPPTVSGTAMPTQYVYNRDGQVTTRLRPDGDNISYVYDSGGRLTEMNTSTRKVHYHYEPLGRRDTVTEQGGTSDQVVTYLYMATGSLVTSMTWTGPVGGASPGLKVALGYENPSPAGTTDFRVVTEDAGDVRAEYGYDGDGLITSVTVKSWNGSAWTTMSNGTMSLVYDPNNGAAKFTGDDNNTARHNGMLYTTSVGSVSDARTYNAYGELDSYSAGDGSTTYLAYDLDDPGSTCGSTTCARDQLGRIIHRVDSAPTSRTWDYTYAAAGWLTEVKLGGSTVERYDYDPNGNRYDSDANGHAAENTLHGESAATSTVIDAQDRLVTYATPSNSKSFTYTKAGDRAARTDSNGQTSYTYDAFGNLLEVDLPGPHTIKYLVDGLGHRVGKQIDGTLTQQWIYDGQLRPVLELDGSGNYKARFIYATHVNVPDLLVTYTGTGPGTPSTVYRVITDHLGSVRAIVPAAGGGTVQTFDYDAFGNVTSASPSLPSDTSTNPSVYQLFGFAGGIYDPHTGLVRFGARDYEAETGRWLSKDVLGFAGGDTNLYAYVQNSPIGFIDPYGTEVLTGTDNPGLRPPDWHVHRNNHNQCPAQEPSQCQTDGTGTWKQDSQALSTVLGHPGTRKWRSSTGNECVYDPNGSLVLGDETFNYGPEPWSLSHFFDDFAAHFWYGGNYASPDPTTVVPCKKPCP